MNSFYLLNDYNITLESGSDSESIHSDILENENTDANNGLSNLSISDKKIPRLHVALDLDRTLIYSSFTNEVPHDFFVDVETQNGVKPVFVTKRPHLEMFLEELSKIADVSIFTAAETHYAQDVVKILDPGNQYIKRMFFRNSCHYTKPNIYVKDLTVIGSPLSRTVLVDDSFVSFGGKLDNAIKVRPFGGDKADRELDGVLALIRNLTSLYDVRPYLRNINAKSFN